MHVYIQVHIPNAGPIINKSLYTKNKESCWDMRLESLEQRSQIETDLDLAGERATPHAL